MNLCETFHLPVVSLTDQGGAAVGKVAEERGTIRHAARAITAVYQARVPQAELITRRVYGVGGAGIVNRHQATRSWPVRARSGSSWTEPEHEAWCARTARRSARSGTDSIP